MPGVWMLFGGSVLAGNDLSTSATGCAAVAIMVEARRGGSWYT
jgi:hypothetical protein